MCVEMGGMYTCMSVFAYMYAYTLYMNVFTRTETHVFCCQDGEISYFE